MNLTEQQSDIENYANIGGQYVAPDQKTVRQVLELVERHFREHRDQEFYLRQVRVGLWRLNKLLLRYTGKTIYGLVQDRLQREAEYLLQHTLLSVKEITYELGLEDPSYFGRCFKRLRGMSPVQFRELYNELPRIDFPAGELQEC